MPEGPEIQYLATILNNNFKNKRLKTVKIVNGRYKKHGPPDGYKEFILDLPLLCKDIQRKGKVLFFYFEKGWVMISRLGMTGWWNINFEEGPHYERHISYRNVLFDFSYKNKTEQVIYSDPRNFGTLTFTQDKTKIENEKNKLGLDITDRKTNWKNFYTEIQEFLKLKKSARYTVEELMTDQQLIICGIGNYLKSEIFYEAKIAPMRKVIDIQDKEWKLLFKIMKSITKKMYSILLKGKGMEEEYEASMKVYSKKVDPLGNKIETYTDPRGRTTHWVPSIQK